ncbi:TPA: hypothetical protein N0F65_010759, partial [Lagenidium giganteum]
PADNTGDSKNDNTNGGGSVIVVPVPAPADNTDHNNNNNNNNNNDGDPVVVVPAPGPVDNTGENNNNVQLPCAVGASAGDVEAGIQVITDPTCVQGGLGCFSDVCRFCKYRSTDKSEHLADCTTFGYKFVDTIPAPASSAKCELQVSEGDAAVGIGIVTDGSCSSGGVGCIDNLCRFCKLRDTDQSQHLVSCSQIGQSNNLGFVPVPVVPAPQPAPAPQSTPAPGPVVVTDGSCAKDVSDGDRAVGVSAVLDAGCVNGGLGCFGDVCRYCRQTDTPQSHHLLDCASLPLSASSSASSPAAPALAGCADNVSQGDAAVGISSMGDTTCAAGGLGCVSDTCRLCKKQTTPNSAHLFSCYVVTPTGVVDVPAPAAPVQPDVDVCPTFVSDGDKAVGVSAFKDESCKNGGLGCFADFCRFCQLVKTDQSAGFLLCPSAEATTPSLQLAATTSENPKTEGFLSFVEDHSKVAAAVGSVQLCVIESTVAETTADIVCNVAPTDRLVGIQSVADITCVSAGNGCYSAGCRACMFRSTIKSSSYVPCSSLGYSFTIGGTLISFNPPGVDPTPTPAPTPALTPAVITTPTSNGNTNSDVAAGGLLKKSNPIPGECEYELPSGDFDNGILLVTDIRCLDGGLGCYNSKGLCKFCQFKTTPQFCKVETTPQSASLLDCSTPAPASTPSPAPSPSQTPPCSATSQAQLQLQLKLNLNVPASAGQGDYSSDYNIDYTGGNSDPIVATTPLLHLAATSPEDSKTEVGCGVGALVAVLLIAYSIKRIGAGGSGDASAESDASVGTEAQNVLDTMEVGVRDGEEQCVEPTAVTADSASIMS